MSHRNGTLVAILLLGTLSGCAAPADDPGSGTGAEEAASPVAWSTGEPRNVTLVLGEGRHMSSFDASAEPFDEPLGWGWSSWLEGVAPPEWQGQASPEDVVIESARAVVNYVALESTTTTGQRPELTVWWGTPGAWVHHAFLDGPDAMAAGDRVKAVFELSAPEGGLVVPRGTPVAMRIGSYYVESEDSNQTGVALGGEDPTRIELELRPIVLPALAVGEPETQDGQLRGGRCLGPDADPEASVELPIEVEENASLLEITLRRTGGTGPPDMDLALSAPDGTRIIRGQGSQADELIRAYRPNLAVGGPGQWTLLVYNCTPQESLFEIVVAVSTMRPDPRAAL